MSRKSFPRSILAVLAIAGLAVAGCEVGPVGVEPTVVPNPPSFGVIGPAASFAGTVGAVPNPVSIDTDFSLTANVDDAATGGSNIASAEYTLDGGTTWVPMNASDGAFDEVAEDVTANVVNDFEPGLHEICVRGTDSAGNTGPEDCTTLVVYDPAGGFVTGGGWITSPEGAIPPTLSEVTISGVSGDASVDPGASNGGFFLRYVGDPAPSNFSHSYQWATPRIVTPSPEDAPVILEGTIDLSQSVQGQVAMIGLLDRDDLAAGNTSFQRGAYIYVFRNSATTWRIGPSDGNSGGEIVQTFVTIPETDLPADGVLNVVFTVDGTADGTTCAVVPPASPAPAGCMTLELSGGAVNTTLTDSYGDVTGAASASPEFSNGAVPGWDDFTDSMVGYEFTLTAFVGGSPAGKATFGFVSKYKKGASTPDGNTQFSFQAGDLNFHSTSYEWLVVNQNDSNAQFKGEGTVNGVGTYKFMLWAGDGTGPNGDDTFRIRITEMGGGVVYDNGPDQEIGGGNIIVHGGKGK
jgi:hypothetical protein